MRELQLAEPDNSLIIHAVKIWISKNSEVAVADQLAAQITLGIAAGDFKLGEKLPSTREVARRCGVHANTVGSVYRKLAEQKVLEFKPGSGFYVAETAGSTIEGSQQLGLLIDALLDAALALGFSREEVLKRMKRTKASSRPEKIVLIEPDDGLRNILVHELSTRSLPVAGARLEDVSSGRLRHGVLLTAMFDEKPRIDPLLKGGEKCIYLKGRSVSAAMSGEARPSQNELIAVISGWNGFLTFARIMLLATKIDPGNLIVRSTADQDWDNATRSASLIICDSLTAHRLNGHPNVRAFQIVSDESIDELTRAIAGSSSS